jgi:hypothetical protein
MPDWLKEDYAKRLNEKYRRKEWDKWTMKWTSPWD